MITVGSVNTRSTALRGDDIVNFFSSRGPSRGVWVDALGVNQHDNLLKPDLVAPGNRVISALSDNLTAGSPYNTLVDRFPSLRVTTFISKQTTGQMTLFTSTTRTSP